jgi:hypothetical protein
MLFYAALFWGSARALPALVPCAVGGRGGRQGLCTTGAGAGAAAAAAVPIALRGANYIRLGGNTVGPNTRYHTTFDVGVYNRTRYQLAFRAMAADGYNVNRVFLDERPGSGIGGPANATVPLDGAWLDRLAQFIADAEARGIYTIVTTVYCPNNAFFRNVSDQLPPLSPAWQGGWNTAFLTANHQAAWVAYAAELAAALAARLAPAAQAATLVSLQNEFFLNGNEYPFGERNGTVADGFADGGIYDMGVAADRQQAADANTNRWVGLCRDAIRAHLPHTLVTVGVFTFQAVHKAGPNGLLLDGCEAGAPLPKGVDCRFPARPLWLSRAGLDFLDVHIYQPDGSPAALAANLATEEWGAIANATPIVMGEFGCNAEWGLNATTCAPRVRQLQISSCDQGFVGWLFWTYDTAEQPDPHWYTVMEAGGAINGVLAPARNPDPCSKSSSAAGKSECQKLCEGKRQGGCCQYDDAGGCLWIDGGWVIGGGAEPGRSAANCHASGTCEVWNDDEGCHYTAADSMSTSS